MTPLLTDEFHGVYETIARYCRSVDRLDLDSIRSVYLPDGIDHHTGFDGTRDEFVTWVAGKLERLTGTMHLIANHLVEPLPDGSVLSETYGTAVHWGLPESDASVNFTSGFRYVDHMRRVDGKWLIAERFAVREWTRSDAGRMIAPEGDGPRGTRDESDPLAALRRRLADGEQ